MARAQSVKMAWVLGINGGEGAHGLSVLFWEFSIFLFFTSAVSIKGDGFIFFVVAVWYFISSQPNHFLLYTYMMVPNLEEATSNFSSN